MNNKITIYELLGKIKDGQAPKRIKINGNIYEYDDEFDMYMCDKKTYKVALGGMENEINLICNAFNEIVEILDNEDEDIEDRFEFTLSDNTWSIKQASQLIDNLSKLEKRLNNKIDRLKKEKCNKCE